MTFEKWAEGQFGEPPSEKSITDLRREVRDTMLLAYELRIKFAEMLRYEAILTAARDAWNAEDKDKHM